MLLTLEPPGESAETVVGRALSEPLHYTNVQHTAEHLRLRFAKSVAQHFDYLSKLQREGLLYVTASRTTNQKRYALRKRHAAIEAILQETSALWWLAHQEAGVDALIAEKLREYDEGTLPVLYEEQTQERKTS